MPPVGSLADDDDGFGASASESACMGDAIMAELGVARFEDAGLEPDDITADDDDSSPGELLGAGAISDAEANAILDTWEGCVDLPALFAASAVEDFDLDDEARACVEEELGDRDLVRQGFVVSFTSDSDEPPAELISALVGVLDGCTSSGGGESGGLIVDGIAESILEDGNLTPEQARCLAQEMVDTIGLDRLIELGGEDVPRRCVAGAAARGGRCGARCRRGLRRAAQPAVRLTVGTGASPRSAASASRWQSRLKMMAWNGTRAYQ